MVVGNLFFIIESRGVLLEEAINVFYSNNYLIDWICFYEDAIKKGWASKTIILKVLYSFEESNFKSYRDETIRLLKFYIKEKECS